MQPRRVRFWPALVVLALAAIALGAIWLGPAAQRQDRLVRSSATLFLAALALLGWWLLLSRVRWRWRLAGVGLVLALGLLTGALLEVRGVSGDVLPQLAWRSSAESSATEPHVGGTRAPLAAASSYDWPQFLGGPRRTARTHDVTLEPDWTTHPPRLVWRRPVGAGWSGFAVSGDHAVTHEQDGPREAVRAYDARTGERLWSYEIEARYENPLVGPGPRATPAIEEGRVFALGATGVLSVLDLASGGLVWSADVFDGEPPPTYGASASPLVTDGLVVAAGTRGPRAFEVLRGQLVWAGEAGPAAYSSPALAELGGLRQVLLFDGSGLSGYDMADGRTLWRVAWPVETQRASQPVLLPGDRVFLSTGYGVGGKLFGLRPAVAPASLEAALLWESQGLKAKFTNVVEHEGHLYGLDDGILVCLDPAGERCWKGGRYGHGQLLLAGGRLIVMAEDGRVVLVEARPTAHVELASFAALAGKTWNHPALAGLRLVVRNDREAACWELPGELRPLEGIARLEAP